MKVTYFRLIKAGGIVYRMQAVDFGTMGELVEIDHPLNGTTGYSHTMRVVPESIQNAFPELPGEQFVIMEFGGKRGLPNGTYTMVEEEADYAPAS